MKSVGCEGGVCGGGDISPTFQTGFNNPSFHPFLSTIYCATSGSTPALYRRKCATHSAKALELSAWFVALQRFQFHLIFGGALSALSISCLKAPTAIKSLKFYAPGLSPVKSRQGQPLRQIFMKVALSYAFVLNCKIVSAFLILHTVR
jgi:hypothetical protein